MKSPHWTLQERNHKWDADGTIAVQHIIGKSNIADIFTKEMHGGTNIHRLCNAFMCRSINYPHNAHSIACSAPTMAHPHKSQSNTSALVLFAHYVRPTTPGILNIIISYPSLCLPSMLSTISSVGQHIQSFLAPSPYMQVLMSNPMGGVVL